MTGQAKHNNVLCPLEMEECKDVPRYLQDPTRQWRQAPRFFEGSTIFEDTASSETYSFWEKPTAGGSMLKENVTTVQDLSYQDITSPKGLESFQVVPLSEEVQGSSFTQAPCTVKDIPMQLPRGKEEKWRNLPSSLSINITDQGTPQEACSQLYSTFQESSTSRHSNAWVRVETNSTRLLEQSHDSCTKDQETGSRLFRPPTSAPIEGWICVDHPPMTWEDALKVAQKARDSATGANLAFNSLLSSSHLTGLPLPRLAGAPVYSQATGKIDTSSQAPSAQGTILSPLPLPPKQSPSIGRTSGESVKAHISAFENSRNKGPGQSTTQLEFEKMQSEKAEMKVGIQDRRLAEEKLRNWRQFPENVVQVEWRHMKNDPVKGHETVDYKGAMGKVQESRFQRLSGCKTTSVGIPAAEEKWDLEVAGHFTVQGESRDTSKLWRLPALEDLNMEAMQKNSFTEDFASAIEDRPLPLFKETGGVLHDDVKSGLITCVKERDAMEELSDMEQKEMVEEIHLPIIEETIKTENLQSPHGHVTSKIQSEPKDSIYVICPSKSLASLNLVPLPVQKLPLPGDAQQPRNCQETATTKARNVFIVPACLNEEFQKTSASVERITSKSVDGTFIPEARMKLAPLKAQAICEAPCENTFKSCKGAISSADESNMLSQLGGAIKQVLAGAVILAGLFAFWPRNVDPAERYHVVKAGETLSSIAPGQCNNPSSKFCKINPQTCDRKIIYPGQRLRLS